MAPLTVIRPVPNVWFLIIAPASVDAMTTTAQDRSAPRQATPPARAGYRDVLGTAEFRAIFAANIVSMRPQRGHLVG